jgi:hypothetical protein
VTQTSKQTGTLARLSRAQKALAEAKTLDEVLAIRDEAEAVRHLLKIRGESRRSQNAAAAVKIRAERKLGDSLAAMEKAKGARESGTNRGSCIVKPRRCPTLA